jgi:DNA-binding winged helix-turn-helix (wHTH) protein
MDVGEPASLARNTGDSQRIVYAFGGFELDPRALQLCSNGRALDLTTKSLSALVYLVQHHERIVTRSELMSALWPNVQVSSGSLSQAIWEIRRALDDDRRGSRFIRTLRGWGYQFRADVVVCARRN